MNQRLSNQLRMIGACLTTAFSKDYKPVWTGKDPADFGSDLAALQLDYEAIIDKAALAESATGGAADAKSNAETALENATHVLARALASHFRKTGDLDRLGKVDVTKSAIVQLRTQDLINKAIAIRDLGTAAQGEPDAAKRGVTVERITTLSSAIAGFSAVMNLPRGQIANRGALLREVETDVAALVVAVGNLDDLALQFDHTEAGRRFIEAWKRARIIVDSGGGGAKDEPVPPTTPPAATS